MSGGPDLPILHIDTVVDIMLESVRGDVLTKCVRNTPKYSGFHSCKYVRPAYKFDSKMGLLVSMVGLREWCMYAAEVWLG